jgi:hypothetical protein
MKRLFILFGAALLSSGALAAELRDPGAFSNIDNDDQRAIALFSEAGKVLTHPRCVNCHPASDRPLQGDEQRPHQPLAVRGDGGLGAPAMRCFTCHSEANYDPAQVPGHPQWHLAPAEMAWEKKSLSEICEQIKDPERNGGMDMAGLVHHMAEDSLVGWAWNPGSGREPAPGSQKVFGELVKAWADAGAACPG